MHRHLSAVVLLAAALAACGGDEPTGPAAVATVTITAATAEVGIGKTLQLTATAKSAGDVPISGATFTWSSSNVAIATVSEAGLVTGVSSGGVTITATASGKTGTYTVNVTSATHAPFTFLFAVGTSAADQQTIRDNVLYAHGYHQTIFGRQVKEPTTIMTVLSPTGGCSQGGAAAFTGLHTVTFCLGNPGWIQPGSIAKQKIVQHETFHLWQFEYKWLGNPATAGATWVIEGSAELMGYKGVDARGLLSFTTAVGCQVKEVADFASTRPPGLPVLSSVETQQAFATTQGPLYAQSMLAMDQLTSSGGGLASLRTYADAIAGGTAWQTAFQSSFGMSTSAFYAQFPSYRAGQAVPPNYLCGG
jgi:hypothetical protein